MLNMHFHTFFFEESVKKLFFSFILKEEKESDKVKEKVINFRLYNLTVKIITSASKHNIAAEYIALAGCVCACQGQLSLICHNYFSQISPMYISDILTVYTPF